MKRIAFALALGLATIPLAQAQTYRDSGGTIVPGVVPLNCPSGGGSCSGPAGSTPSVGAGTIATGQFSNATGSATQIVAARTGAPGTGRVSITLYDSGTATCFIGVTGVTSSTGIRILPGGSYTIYTTAAVYGVPASGTCALDYLETY